jgi:catechol 2,3-dioxygenase-like lactoylglutathione lyase family enzyme
MINGIHHPAISTPDIDRLVAFYTGVGFKVVAENQWDKGTEFADTITDLKDSSARQVLLHLGNCYLELFQFLSPEPRAPTAGARSVIMATRIFAWMSPTWMQNTVACWSWA